MNFKEKTDRILKSPILRVMIREMDRISGSWVLVFTTILGPLFSFLLITWIFSSSVVRDLAVTVVDLDQSQLSGKICRMADAIPAANVVSKTCTLEEARSLMQRGETDAVIYIPKGLEASVQKGGQADLALYINNTNVVKGGVLQSQLTTTLATLSAAVKVQTMIKRGMPPSEALPSAQPVRPDVHLLFNPYGSYAYFLMLGLMPLLAVVFIFLGSAYAIGTEMKDGTGADWIRLAGGSTTVAMIGKLVPYVVLFFADMMAMNLLLVKVMGTPLNGSLWMIICSEFLLIMAYQAMAILLLTITVNLRLTLSLGSAYTMMALTFSGLTFPSMAMPLAAKIFSFIFPYTFWLRLFISQSLRGEPAKDAIMSLVLLIPFILAGIFIFPLFKHRLTDERWQTKN